MPADLKAEPVRFAMFDWLDESGRDLGDTYEERLRMLELADQSGFFAYHLAEHHATELSTVPSPNLFLTAVAQRTHRLRLGALTYVLPAYEPVRLLEEIAMLDQLSNGRVELGLSRGSTGEHVEDDPEKARAMFGEALEVILQGLATGDVDYHGRFYSYDHVLTRLRPKQKPYPPLWYPTSSVDSIDWVARNGISTAFSMQLSGVDGVAGMLDRYRTQLAAHVSDENRLNGHVERPNYGFSMHVHVAETDELAREQARPAFDHFMHNFTYRFVRRGMPNRYQDRANFDTQLAKGALLIGSPETVRETLRSHLQRTGANYFIGTFAFGSLPLEQVLSSVGLFAREVMPALRTAEKASIPARL
ncbi:MAG TPA: LLM class flavin-dependent oxidoreductase [Chloroflexota bacterium]|jgi:alkanesulfonate monooxygenase SsuD/methylene tetrahydromethanopterin reductase-like flavin-dependent oxidoreductase (luciferase family)|nr:LLM class flavin-dependent oxidoreductase [Chloroflexota bacterium]